MYISASVRLLKKLSLCVSIICFLCISSDVFGFGQEEQKKQIETLWKQYIVLNNKYTNEVITPRLPEILKQSDKYVFNRIYNNVKKITIRDQVYTNPVCFEIDRKLSIDQGYVRFQNKYLMEPRGKEKRTIKETYKEFKIISQVEEIPNVFRKYKTLFLVEMHYGQNVVKGILGSRTGWFWKNKHIYEFVFFLEKALDNKGEKKKLTRQCISLCSQGRKKNQVLSINYFAKSSFAREKYVKVDKPEVKSPDAGTMFEIHIPKTKSNYLYQVN